MDDQHPNFHLHLLGGFRLLSTEGAEEKEIRISGKKSQALLAFKAVLSISPNFLPVRGALAGVYYETGQHELARKHAAIVREQQPGYRLVKRLNWEKTWHAPYAAHLERMFRFSEKAGIPWE